VTAKQIAAIAANVNNLNLFIQLSSPFFVLKIVSVE
jgi:hypothetical protein